MEIKIRFMPKKIIACSSIVALFFMFSISSNSVHAASVTVNVPDSSWVDATASPINPGFGPSNGGFPGAGTASGWQEDFSASPPGYTADSSGAVSVVNVPSCVTSDITMTLYFEYEQINASVPESGELGAMIINQGFSMGASIVADHLVYRHFCGQEV